MQWIFLFGDHNWSQFSLWRWWMTLLWLWKFCGGRHSQSGLFLVCGWCIRVIPLTSCNWESAIGSMSEREMEVAVVTDRLWLNHREEMAPWGLNTHTHWCYVRTNMQLHRPPMHKGATLRNLKDPQKKLVTIFFPILMNCTPGRSPEGKAIYRRCCAQVYINL